LSGIQNNLSCPYIYLFKLINNLFDFRVSQVCRLWRIVASDPLLWTNIDLAGRWVSKNPIRNDINFRWLCENRLTRVQELNLGK